MRKTVSLWLALLSAAAGAALVPAADFVHEDAAGKLKVIGQAAVVITGDDQFVSRIMEDVLTVVLLAKGVKVAYPEEASFGKWRKDAAADPMQIARKAGANVLVTGTVITEPVYAEYKVGHAAYRSLKVSLASLSLIDVPQEKTLVWALYEPEEATTISKVARAFAGKLMEALK